MMRSHHLLLTAFFVILMITPGLAPDTPHDVSSCEINGGFCYHAAKCPSCFGKYGSCDFGVTCCFRESWRPECEGATTPSDTWTSPPSTTDAPQKSICNSDG